MGNFLPKEIEPTDIFIFLGLVLTGVGLFLFCGMGVALTVVGALLFCMGYFSGANNSNRKKG